ncbi:hypothetical protein ASPBRDRAFT_474115 [Aspergillus brasiliensis CBS 101740]|uniref:Uncharacterized protein n=1 Tax=Aspergillus brasiliensis (strain CBS 101740 / IMI 381727 / IBT 21946) TaxID=767769 RepID=A0A1L9UTI8_ASPBC|nr:hypothetical protein ASPBRDRAFT_474115 [Aspergillus brasiliensis CBS 101740]
MGPFSSRNTFRDDLESNTTIYLQSATWDRAVSSLCLCMNYISLDQMKYGGACWYPYRPHVCAIVNFESSGRPVLSLIVVYRFQWEGNIRACKLQGTGHLPSNQARTCFEWRLNLRPQAGPASRSSSEGVWPQFCSPASFGPDQTWPVFSRFFVFHFSSLFSFVLSPGGP